VQLEGHSICYTLNSLNTSKPILVFVNATALQLENRAAIFGFIKHSTTVQCSKMLTKLFAFVVFLQNCNFCLMAKPYQYGNSDTNIAKNRIQRYQGKCQNCIIWGKGKEYFLMLSLTIVITNISCQNISCYSYMYF